MNEEQFQRGLAIRKSVLGAEFVENSIANAGDFDMPMQRLTTEYCGGAVWGRELKMHIAGALRNGVSKEEIREVLLQVAIYCGIPAGVDAFRIAKGVFAEIDSADAK